MGGFKASNTNVTVMNADDLEVDSGTLSVDATNNRIGIGLTTPKTELTVEGTITVKERAAAQSDTAAYGQLWVKSDSPCNLYFTDDSGQDVQITSDGSVAGSGGSLSGLGSNDNRILRSNGTGGETAQGSGVTIDDSANMSGVGTLGCGAITTTDTLTLGAGGNEFSIAESSDDITISSLISNKDMIFKVNDGGSATEVFRLDGDVSALKIASGKELQFADSGEKISSDGTDLTVASGGKITLDSTTAVEIDSASGDVTFMDGGTAQLALDMDGTSGEVIMQLKVDSDDFVFKQYDGTEVFRVEDNGDFDIGGGAGSTGVTITSAGVLTADGRIIVDDATDATSKTDGSLQTDGGLSVAKAIYNGTAVTLAADSGVTTIGSTTAATFSAAGLLNINNATEATSTTDGSLQTDGGLSVAKSAVIGDDLDLLSDGAIVNFGADKEITLTHVHDTGLILASELASTPVFEIRNTNNGGNAGMLKFNNTEGSQEGADGDDLGSIQFWGNDDGTPSAQQYAGILAEISDASSGAEGGKLSLQVAEHDGTVTTGLLLQDGDADGEIDVTIGAGAASLVTVPGVLFLSGSSSEALRIAKDDDDAREIVFENGGADKAAIYLNSAENLFIRQEAAAKDINLRIASTNAVVVDGSASKVTLAYELGVGTAAGSGQDAYLYTAGTAAHVGIQWDADGETEGILIGGADDHGVDFKFFGETAGNFVHWDMSGDELVLAATSKISFHDAGGDENIVASSDGHLEVNAGTTLDMTAPTVDINASTAVTVDSDLVTFGSANANDPLVVIKNTTNDAASPRLRFVKDKGAAGADNDNIGTIEFYGDDDAQDNIEFASIGAQVADASNGAEGGRLVLRVATHDGEMQSGITIQDGDAEDEVDVTIGNGPASLTTIAGEMKVTEDFFQGDARRVIYEEVDVRKCDSTDNTVSVQFGNKIPQDSVVTRVVAMVKTASNLGTHNVNIRFDVGDGRAADYNAGSTSSEALGAGAADTRSSTNVGSAVDIDLTAAKESYINNTPAFMTTADVYPYVMNAGTSNGTSDASSGTLLIYIEYYGID